MRLTLEGKLGEMVNLGEKIYWDIGLPKSNLITLVQEGVSEPEMQFEEVEFAFRL
jgi:hypothetical protein